MACKACERRRKALKAKQQAKRERGKRVQAAAIGAALAVADAAGKVIHGEVEDGRDGKQDQGSGE